MMEASKGIVGVRIISAETLKKSSLDTIQAAVTSMVGKDKKVNLEVLVPSDTRMKVTNTNNCFNFYR
jgi:F0F1-type ATP synthase delta subunit